MDIRKTDNFIPPDSGDVWIGPDGRERFGPNSDLFGLSVLPYQSSCLEILHRIFDMTNDIEKAAIEATECQCLKETSENEMFEKRVAIDTKGHIKSLKELPDVTSVERGNNYWKNGQHLITCAGKEYSLIASENIPWEDAPERLMFETMELKDGHPIPHHEEILFDTWDDVIEFFSNCHRGGGESKPIGHSSILSGFIKMVTDEPEIRQEEDSQN